MEEIGEWAEDAQRSIQAIGEQEVARGVTDFSSGPVYDASQQFIAASEVKESEMTEFVLRHEMGAWEEAVTALREMGAKLPS